MCARVRRRKKKGACSMIYLPPQPEGAPDALRDWLERLTRELDRLEERVAELEANRPML